MLCNSDAIQIPAQYSNAITNVQITRQVFRCNLNTVTYFGLILLQGVLHQGLSVPFLGHHAQRLKFQLGEFKVL